MKTVYLVCATIVLFSVMGMLVSMGFVDRPATLPDDWFLYNHGLVGTIVQFESRITGSVAVMRLESVNGKDLETFGITKKIKMRISLPRYVEYRPGDVISMYEKLSTPEDFITDTGRIFQYEEFLLKDDIYARVSNPSIEHVSPGTVSIRHFPRYFNVTRLLYVIKHSLIARTNRLMPEPAAGLSAGILYGEKGLLTQELQDIFRRTGIIHIVVLSGYNVTIVVIFILALLKKLRRIPKVIVASTFIVGFTLLTGAGATTVRAAIMTGIVLLAGLLGRKSAALRGLLYAGIIMVIVNPSIILYDPSFQLSYLATLGLILLGPWFMNAMNFVPDTFGLREHVSATLATTSFVTPYLVWMMGEVSFVSPIINMLVLPWIPLAMATSFATQLISFLWEPLGYIFAYPTIWILGGIASFTTWIDSVIPTTLQIPQIPLWLVALLYLPILLWGISSYRRFQNHDLFQLDSSGRL